MKKSSRVILIYLLLSFCVCLSGCATKDYYDTACDLYGGGRYEEAEEYFLLALEDSDDIDIRLGHGYNLAMLEREEDAITELYPVFSDLTAGDNVKVSDIPMLFDVGDILIDLYMSVGSYINAQAISKVLYNLSDTAEKKEIYELTIAQTDVDIYKGNDKYIDSYRAALKKLVDLSDYAGEAYLELVESYKSTGQFSDMLTTTDDMIIYMRGRSSYITDYPTVISVILDAASTSSFTEHTYGADHYYETAEEFIVLAGESGLTDDQALRYKILIAERQNKPDVAIRLLGVYLNHWPDDESAQKERDFLEFGFK